MNTNEFDITQQFHNLINKWYSSATADPTVKVETTTGQRKILVAKRNEKTESVANDALAKASGTQSPTALAKKKLNPIERNELYTETLKLASDLEKLLNNYIKEKYDPDELLNSDPNDWDNSDPDNWLNDNTPLFSKLLLLLQEVDGQRATHPQWESEVLALWIARNTTHEYKAGADDYAGAYKSFHQLSQVINKISETLLKRSNEMNIEPESLETGPLENGLPFIDKSALKYIDESEKMSEEITNMPREVLALVSESLSLADLFALQKISNAGAKAIDSTFVKEYIVYCLNINKIKLPDIGVDSVKTLIDFLGNQAIKLQSLGKEPITNVDTQALDLLAKSCPNLTQLAFEVDKGAEISPLTYTFNNLKTLSLYSMGSNSVENILIACPNISSLTCTDINIHARYSDLNFSEKLFSVDLPYINELHIDGGKLDLIHIGNFSNLTTFSVFDCLVEDFQPLVNCKSLISLSIVEETINQSNIVINDDLPNLKVFEANGFVEDYSFLNQAKLEYFKVNFNEGITDLDFLSTSYSSLSKLSMLHFDPKILSSLKKFPNLNTLILCEPIDYDRREEDVRYEPIDLSGILDCKKLEVLEIDYQNVGDFKILNKIPLLKEVRLYHVSEPAEKDKKAIKDLEAKGVKVIIKQNYSY